MLKLLVFASAIALALGDGHGAATTQDCDSAEANSCAECLCAFDMSCGSEQQEWCDANLMGCVGYLSCPEVDGLLADAGLSMEQVMGMVAGMSMNGLDDMMDGVDEMMGDMMGGMADMMGDMMGDDMMGGMTDMLGGASLDILQAGLQAARAAATAQGCSRRDRRMFSDMGMDITSMMGDMDAPDCGTLLAAVAAGESAVQAAGGTIGDASGASAVTATMAGVVVVVAAMLF